MAWLYPRNGRYMDQGRCAACGADCAVWQGDKVEEFAGTCLVCGCMETWDAWVARCNPEEWRKQTGGVVLTDG